MAVDIRYVGTRGVDQWSELNYNALDLESNGFYEEFTNAVNNLRANNAAGPHRQLRLLRAGHRHDATPHLPRVHQRADQLRRSGGVHRDDVDEHRAHQ